MTVCNMSIEAGARAGMIAPDETTFEYLRGREYAPQGEAFDAAVEEWKKTAYGRRRAYDTVVEFDVDTLDSASDLGNEPGHGNGHHVGRSGSGRLPDGERAQSGRKERWNTWV